MLHIGTFEWKKTISNGEFFCPHCEAQQNFRYRSSRHFLTLYFIPLIPISRVSHFVECKKCRARVEIEAEPARASTLDTAGTNNRPNDEPFHTFLIHVLAAVIMEDRIVDGQEVEAAYQVFPYVCGRKLVRQELLEACRTVATTNGAKQIIANRAKTLSVEQRLLLIQAIFVVASATGKISARRNQIILYCKDLFGFSDEDVEIAIEQTLDWN